MQFAENTELLEMQDSYALKTVKRTSEEPAPASTDLHRPYSYMMSMLQFERQNKRSRIQYESEIDDAMKEIKKYKSDNGYLKIEIDGLNVRLKKLHEEVDNLRKENVELSKQNSTNLKTFLNDKRALEEECNQLRDEKNTIESSTTEELWSLKRQVSSLSLQKEEAEHVIDMQMRLTEETSKRLKEAEEEVRDLNDLREQLKDLRQFKDQYQEDSILLKNLKEQYKNFPQIHNEYLTLKENQENCQLLQEQLEDMKAKFERSEARCSEMVKVYQENQELKEKLTLWNSMKNLRQGSAEDVFHNLATLQNSEAVLLQNQASLNSRINHLEETVQKKEVENSEMKSKLFSADKENTLLADKLRVREQRLRLIKQQRDSFREILDTYERDCTFNLPASLINQPNMDAVMAECEGRCKDLEKNLQDANNKYKKSLESISELTIKLNEVKKEAPSAEIMEADKRIIEHLRGQVSELTQKLEKTSDEKCHLEYLLNTHCATGGLDPRETRALQFTENPTTVAQRERATELQTLKEENHRLKERVRLLEEGDNVILNITQQIDENIKQTGSAEDIDNLRAKLQGEEKKNVRLMEVFKKTSHELRSVMRQLTGFEIFIMSTANYKVHHVFTPSHRDSLFFRQSSSGLHLLENDFSLSLKDLADKYLTKHQCLPAFMNALALDLFNKYKADEVTESFTT